MKTWFLPSMLVVTMILFAGLLLLIWFNRDSERVWSLSLKVIGAVAAGAFLLIYELQSPLEEYVVDVPVIVILDDELQLAPLTRPLADVGSQHLQFSTSFFMAKSLAVGTIEIPEDHDKAFDARQEYALDLLEKAFWMWVGQGQPGHWQTEQEMFYGVAGYSGSTRQAASAERNPRLYSAEEIRSLLGKNTLIGATWGIGLCLPSGSRLSIERSEGARTARIDNRHVSVEIDMQSRSGGYIDETGMLQTLLYDLAQPEGKWTSAEINVRFRARYNRWLRGSSSTAQQREWIEAMTRRFEHDFGWTGIREDLEKYLLLKRTPSAGR